ncbi:MAG TPA: hypothetical protein HA263_03915 [Methanoregulaceae archaeon]|nr:hypothetical protein [Methanoregulaceae archaeon]
MKGILPGDAEYARVRSFVSGRGPLRYFITWGRWPGSRLDPFLARAAATVRSKFGGRITCGSGPWEHVDWRQFDLVSVNNYRDAGNTRTYRRGLARHYAHGKPVAITEFGCCTYQGTDEKGAAGWAIVDTSRERRSVRGGFVRSEETQSRYLSELLTLFMEEPIDAAFVFQVASYSFPTSDDPAFDLDMASYGIVTVQPDARHGTRYPEMPWEPKLSFQAVADRYTG